MDVLANFSLCGKVAVLTGAAGFFGRYFATALLEAGVEMVYLLDKNLDGLIELFKVLSDEKRPRPLNFQTIQVDQSNEQTTSRVFEQILAAGSVDVLVNNSFQFGPLTGFNDPTGRVEMASKGQVMASFESGAWWPFRATQLVASAMKNKGSGSVVNIASMYGLVAPNPDLYEGRDYFNPIGYSLAKAALIAQTRYLAAWLGPEVRVNALAPGAIPNNESRSENSEQNKDEEFVQRLVARTLLKRVGHPLDLVGPLIFLCSDASRYMTGQTVVVDGGWTTT